MKPNHPHKNNIFYTQNFESGVKPAGWSEWNSLENHPRTWGYQPALDGQRSLGVSYEYGDMASGVFYQLDQTRDEIYVTFLFSIEDIPAANNEQVFTLYNKDGVEAAQLYLNQQGQFYLAMLNGQYVSVKPPIAAGQKVRLWIHYKVTSPNSAYGSLAWSLGTVEPTGGDHFASGTTPASANTPTPGIAKLGFGPVYENKTSEFFDDLILATSPIHL